MTRKQGDRSMGKILVEFTRLTSVVSGHTLPIIKDSSLLVELSATQRGIQELRDICRIDGIPLQEEVVTVKILDALTKAVEVTEGILLRLEEGHVLPLLSATAAVDEAALNLSLINAAFKEYETVITAAADGRATIPNLLRRRATKCKQYLTANIPYGVDGRAPRISCPRTRTKPDGDIVRHYSRRWRATGILQTGHRMSRSAYLNTFTP